MDFPSREEAHLYYERYMDIVSGKINHSEQYVRYTNHPQSLMMDRWILSLSFGDWIKFQNGELNYKIESRNQKIEEIIK